VGHSITKPIDPCCQGKPRRIGWPRQSSEGPARADRFGRSQNEREGCSQTTPQRQRSHACQVQPQCRWLRSRTATVLWNPQRQVLFTGGASSSILGVGPMLASTPKRSRSRIWYEFSLHTPRVYSFGAGQREGMTSEGRERRKVRSRKEQPESHVQLECQSQELAKSLAGKSLNLPLPWSRARRRGNGSLNVELFIANDR